MGDCHIGFNQHQAAAMGPLDTFRGRVPRFGRQCVVRDLLQGMVNMGGSPEAAKTLGAKVEVEAGLGIACDKQRFGSVLLFDTAQAFCQQIDAFFPVVKSFKGPVQSDACAGQCDPFGRDQSVHKGNAFGAQTPLADRMVFISLNVDNSLIFNIGDQPTPNGTFLTAGRDSMIIILACTRFPPQRNGFEHANPGFSIALNIMILGRRQGGKITFPGYPRPITHP